MSRARITYGGLVLGLAVALGACSGGSGGGGPGGGNTLFHGTWVSDVDITQRGSLRLDGTISYGKITGTLTLNEGTPSETAVQVSGTETYDYGGGYTVYDLSGGGFNFGSVLYGSLKDNVMIGSYTSASDSGSWHTIVSDGTVEPTIEKTFALPTGWKVTDLCFASGTLYATATPDGLLAPALYQVDQDTGGFTIVSGAPSSPAGIASDGSRFWISTGGTIQTYDSSWSNTGTLATGLLNTPSQLAYQGGAVWFVDSTFPSFPVVVNIDSVTAAATTTAVSPLRPEGIEFLGDQLWIGYYPAGGAWAQVHQYDTSTGAAVKGFFAPDDSQDLMNGAGPLAAQGTSLWMVSGPGLYKLTPP